MLSDENPDKIFIFPYFKAFILEFIFKFQVIVIAICGQTRVKKTKLYELNSEIFFGLVPLTLTRTKSKSFFQCYRFDFEQVVSEY